jgi:hypothetical protein
VVREEEEVREPEPAPMPEPLAAAPSLFSEPEATPEPESSPASAGAPAPAAEPAPAWRQFIEERERWATGEPAPTFIEEPEETQRQPAEVTSFWPGQDETELQATPGDDNAWALPDDQGGPVATEGESAAFPHAPPTPVPQQETEVVVPPLAEHDDWARDDEPYRAPPQPSDEDVLQHEPEAPEPDVDPEEQEARRRQQEEAARAYEQMREDQ